MRSLVLAFLSAVLIGFSGCKPEPQAPYSLVVHWVGDPSDLHPTNRRTANAGEVLGLTHQTLMEIDGETNDLSPVLAESFTQSPDGKVFTYLLREEAAWPDGTPLRASDVVFSYKAMICPLTNNENQKDYLEYVTSVEADPKNDRIVIIRTSEYYFNNPYLSTLALILDPRRYDPTKVLSRYSYSDLVLHGKVAENDPGVIAWAEAFNSDKNGHDPEALDGGTGPYKLISWVPDDRLTLQKKENYWAADLKEETLLQGPETIYFKIVKEEKAVELQLLSGEIDLSTNLSTDTYLSLLAQDSSTNPLTLKSFPRNTVAMVGLNNRPDGVKHKALFDDARVRRAISLASPVDSIVAKVNKKQAFRSASPVPPNHPDYNKQLQLLPNDIDAARALLDAAGWVDTDGNGIRDKVINGKKQQFSFSLKYPGGQKAMELLVNILQDAYKSIGLECKPEANPNISADLRAHNFDAILTAFGAPSTPYDFKQIWHSTNWPEGDNFFGYYNPKADSLIDLARNVTDNAVRRKLVDEIQVLIYEDQPAVFFSSPTEKLAFNKRFAGTTVHNSRPYIYLNAVEEKPARP